MTFLVCEKYVNYCHFVYLFRDADDLLSRSHHLKTRHNVSVAEEVGRLEELLHRLGEHSDTLNQTLRNLSSVKKQNINTKDMLQELEVCHVMNIIIHSDNEIPKFIKLLI